MRPKPLVLLAGVCLEVGQVFVGQPMGLPGDMDHDLLVR